MPLDRTKAMHPRTRELSRIVSFYLRHVRRHDRSAYVGIYRQMLLMIEKGVTAAQMAQAARNYAKSDFVKSIPGVRRHHICRFFTRERIKQWAVHHENAQRDRSIVALDHLARAAKASQSGLGLVYSDLPPRVAAYARGHTAGVAISGSAVTRAGGRSCAR
jgi:hypothetical protein